MSKTLFLFKNSGQNIEKAIIGEYPNHFYCYLNFKEEFPETEFLDLKNNNNLVSRYLFKLLRIDKSLIYYFKKRKYLNSFDNIFATTDGIAITLCKLKKWGVVNTNLVINLFSILDNPTQKKKIKNLNYADKIIVYSIDLYKKLQPKYENVKLLKFGIDTVFYSNKNHQNNGEYILSIGLDPQRDWTELNRIATLLPNEKFYVISNDFAKGFLTQPNIKFIGNVDHIKTREYILKAKLLILTTKKNNYFSGQTTLFMGLSMGKKVIMQNNKNLDFYNLKSTNLSDSTWRIIEKNYKLVKGSSDSIYSMEKYFIDIKKIIEN
jgi:hypothetical protein